MQSLSEENNSLKEEILAHRAIIGALVQSLGNGEIIIDVSVVEELLKSPAYLQVEMSDNKLIVRLAEDTGPEVITMEGDI